MRPCENRGRVTLENIDQISIVPICGGNAEIDLLALVVGQFVDEAQAGKARMKTAAQGIFVKAPIIIVIGSYLRVAKEECQTDLHPGLAHEKETVAYLKPRQTHAIDYDPFNPPEDVWQDGWQVRAEDAPSF
jgi:hypothetical protein